MDAATPGQSAAGYQYVPKTSKRAFDATAQQRFDDALVSLDYLLLRELPREWTAVRYFMLIGAVLASGSFLLFAQFRSMQNHTRSLLKFLRIFTDLYPTSSSRTAVALSVYQKLIKLVEADAVAPGKFLTDKVISLVGKSRPWPQVHVLFACTLSLHFAPHVSSPHVNLLQWSVCAAVSDSSSPVSPQRSLKASNLRGNTAAPPAVSANSTAGSIVARRSDGYPCGLWFLFHYMTGKFHSRCFS